MKFPKRDLIFFRFLRILFPFRTILLEKVPLPLEKFFAILTPGADTQPSLRFLFFRLGFAYYG